jgi:hypothetical protein
MTDKIQATKEFIAALAKDDYVQADKVFPNVVKAAVENVINNKKPAILKQLSAQAEQVAKEELKGTDKKE